MGRRRRQERGCDPHPGDIRQLQLAKSAIYSGIVLLQRVMGIDDEHLAELMLCGGFGNYINTESAVAIRLLPNISLDRIAYVGNAAHLGAQMALLSEHERERAEGLARRIEHVALARAAGLPGHLRRRNGLRRRARGRAGAHSGSRRGADAGRGRRATRIDRGRRATKVGGEMSGDGATVG